MGGGNAGLQRVHRPKPAGRNSGRPVPPGRAGASRLPLAVGGCSARPPGLSAEAPARRGVAAGSGSRGGRTCRQSHLRLALGLHHVLSRPKPTRD